jgi:hypothetical protein
MMTGPSESDRWKSTKGSGSGGRGIIFGVTVTMSLVMTEMMTDVIGVAETTV